MDANTPLTNGAERGRRSRVVLTPRRWRQVLFRSKATVTTSPITGEITKETVKTVACGNAGYSGLPVVTNSYAFLFCMRGCGCVGTRHSPRPSHGKGGKFTHNSDAFAPRERGRVTDLAPSLASAAKQSSFLLSLTMDCFAALAMTAKQFAVTPLNIRRPR